MIWLDHAALAVAVAIAMLGAAYPRYGSVARVVAGYVMAGSALACHERGGSAVEMTGRLALMLAITLFVPPPATTEKR